MEEKIQRVLDVVVLDVAPEDECALVETVDGTQSQFVVSRAVAREHWAALRTGVLMQIVVSPGRLGRVLAVYQSPAGRTGVP